MKLKELLEIHNMYCNFIDRGYPSKKDNVLDFFSWMRGMIDETFLDTIMPEKFKKEFFDLYGERPNKKT